jgi:hypothetical protein
MTSMRALRILNEGRANVARLADLRVDADPQSEIANILHEARGVKRVGCSFIVTGPDWRTRVEPPPPRVRERGLDTEVFATALADLAARIRAEREADKGHTFDVIGAAVGNLLTQERRITTSQIRRLEREVHDAKK